MVYRSDRDIVQDLLPIRIFTAVITHGIDDPEGDTAKQILTWLGEAESEALLDVDGRKADQLCRRSWRLHAKILEPFVAGKVAVAKFALVAFYVLDTIRRQGKLQYREDGPLDRAIGAILAEDGTVTEFANIKKIDESAQKQARKMFSLLQDEGYYRGLVWE